MERNLSIIRRMSRGKMGAQCAFILLLVVAYTQAIPILPPTLESHHHSSNTQDQRVAAQAQVGFDSFVVPDEEAEAPASPRFREIYTHQKDRDGHDMGIPIVPGAPVLYANDMESEPFPSRQERVARARNSVDRFDSHIHAEEHRFKESTRPASDLSRFLDEQLRLLAVPETTTTSTENITASISNNTSNISISANSTESPSNVTVQANATNATNSSVATSVQNTTDLATQQNTTAPVAPVPKIIASQDFGDAVVDSETCYLWSPRKSPKASPEYRQNHFIWMGNDGVSMHLYGGCSEGTHAAGCATTLNIWNASAKTWKDVPITSSQPVRMKSVGAAMCYDGNTLYEFGGRRERQGVTGSTASKAFGVLTESGGAWSWNIQSTTGSNVPALVDASLTCMKDYVLLFGGYTESGVYKKTVYYMPTTGPSRWNWTKAIVNGVAPVPRAGHTATRVGSRSVIVFGGNDGKQAFNDMYMLTVPESISKSTTFEWALIKPGGNPTLQPAARSYHTANLMPNNRLVIYGGSDVTGSPFGDIAIFNVQTFAFMPKASSLQTATSLPPIARNRHSSVVAGKMNNLLIVVGGCSRGIESQCSDVFAPVVLDTNGVCPNKCGSYGKYELDNSYRAEGLNIDRPVCVCIAGYEGKFCHRKVVCTNDCGKHGRCVSGQCVCDLGWGGTVCNKPRCPKNCHSSLGQGMCSALTQRCICAPDFWGLDCGESACLPWNCMGRGICQLKSANNGTNVCKCSNGFSGPSCEYFGFDTVLNTNIANAVGSTAAPTMFSFREVDIGSGMRFSEPTPSNITNIDGKTVPAPAPTTTTSPATQSTTSGLGPTSTTPPVTKAIYVQDFKCPNNCTGQGICQRRVSKSGIVYGDCGCSAGFGGIDCSGECALHCSTQGTCKGFDRYDVTCECQLGFNGVGCSESFCYNNCGEHGFCSNNTCFCHDGWVGPGCSIHQKCSGHGQYDLANTKCVCDSISSVEAWAGTNCDIVVNTTNCGPHGKCTGRYNPTTKQWEGVCSCEDEWTGPTCSQRRCPGDCNHQGACLSSGVCACYSGYAGRSCNITLQCPNNCTNTHGICRPDPTAALDVTMPSNKGVCLCNDNWSGPACADLGCTAQCFMRGTCIEGKCLCDSGYSGTSCEIMCPSRCSGNGHCINGTCSCFPGFDGADCATTKKCPGYDSPRGSCYGNGVCFNPTGTCHCAPGFSGSDCSRESTCNEGCGINGICKFGKCWCDPGFEGNHCEIKSDCQNGCSGQGTCMHGKCFCNTGFMGDSCEKFSLDTTCPKNCSSNGVCQFGRCFCAPGFAGSDCSVAISQDRCLLAADSKQKCEGHGVCKYAKCHCFPGFSGSHCQLKETCPDGCVPSQGICMAGQCHCLPGFKGPDCSEDEVCSGTPPCSGHGICLRGKCACNSYYDGPSCERLIAPGSNQSCPNACSRRGVCHLGQCFCVDGWTGGDCTIKTQDRCPFGCNNKGICRFNQCFCQPGHVGVGCEVEVKCDSSCLRNGVCAYGKCFCAPGYSGKNCDMPQNQDVLSKQLEKDLLLGAEVARQLQDRNASSNYCEGGCKRGICVNSTCFCDTGFQGRNCDQLVSTALLSNRCGNNCSGSGQCIFGRCFCFPGRGGSTCEKEQPMPCPHHNCNGHGICHYGRCFCDPSYSGLACNETVRCSPTCGKSGHGVCVGGQCVCALGWDGLDCDKPTGVPPVATQMSFRSTDVISGDLSKSVVSSALPIADEEPCEADCGDNGICMEGECYCKHGFTGSDCSKLEHPHSRPNKEDSLGLESETTNSHLLAGLHNNLQVAPKTSVSYMLLSALSFVGGIVVCIVAQLGYARYKEAQRQKKTKEIFKPLLNSVEG